MHDLGMGKAASVCAEVLADYRALLSQEADAAPFQPSPVTKHVALVASSFIAEHRPGWLQTLEVPPLAATKQQHEDLGPFPVAIRVRPLRRQRGKGEPEGKKAAAPAQPQHISLCCTVTSARHLLPYLHACAARLRYEHPEWTLEVLPPNEVRTLPPSLGSPEALRDAYGKRHSRANAPGCDVAVIVEDTEVALEGAIEGREALRKVAEAASDANLTLVHADKAVRAYHVPVCTCLACSRRLFL